MKPTLSGVVALVLVGLVFHGVYLLSIFDIYFRSPIVHGMPPYSVPMEAPAKRLVLFVADGLRADVFFETIPAKITRAPFLRSIVEHNGTWGVSHTRVPTETRPGHVAMIAGLYEDVSAVTKGWKHNPVEFDSVLNRSSATFGYGSPDVLPMFSHGSDHIHLETYEAEDENFGEDASFLDDWVFDKIENLLKKVKDEPDGPLAKKIRQPGVVLFLHLLAMDTYGHAYRPYSSEYLDHLSKVDEGIKKVYDMIEDLFPDKKTAYVFTSDHGMSNKGNHGDGERANTETPIVCWGAGVDSPHLLQKKSESDEEGGWEESKEEAYDVDRNKRIRSHNDPTPRGWKLGHLVRRDVNQADITPLMAALIGVPFPVNSVGVLPMAHLPPDTLYATKALFYNAKQVLAQYLAKATHRQEATLEILYQPFHPLTNHAKTVQEIERRIEKGEYKEANEASLDLIDLALQGLHYYQVYDWPFIMTIVTAGYLGWIATVLVYTVNHYTDHPDSPSKKPFLTRRSSSPFSLPSLSLALRTGVPLATGFLFLFLQRSPFMYYLYMLFPVLFWGWVLGHIGPTWSYLRGSGKKQKKAYSPSSSIALAAVLSFLCMQCAVVGYFHREVFVIALIGVAVWTAIGYSGTNNTTDALSFFGSGWTQYVSLRHLWWISCVLVGVFPLIPLDFGESVPLVLTGALLVAHLGVPLLFSRPFGGNKRTKIYLIALTLLAAFVVYSSTKSLALKQGLPIINQYLAWAIFACSIAFLFWYPRSHTGVLEGLACLYLAVAPSFVLLCIAYEALFYAALALHLFVWVLVEVQFFSGTPPTSESGVPRKSPFASVEEAVNSVTVHDARRAVIYIIQCYLALFGTGNVASISSFEISSTYRFVTVFRPFLMTALLVYKLTAPILLVSSTYFGLTKILRVPRPAVFLLVIALADIMTLDFFFLVRDEGSWQEIGISIGHFAISNFFIILQLLFFSLSSLLLRIPTPLSPLPSSLPPSPSISPSDEPISILNGPSILHRPKKTHTS